jgi:hypothetical protein
LIEDDHEARRNYNLEYWLRLLCQKKFHSIYGKPYYVGKIHCPIDKNCPKSPKWNLQ